MITDHGGAILKKERRLYGKVDSDFEIGVYTRFSTMLNPKMAEIFFDDLTLPPKLHGTIIPS